MAQERKPNVVFILVDNVGWGDFGVYGGTIPTPRIDKLASEGIRFNNYNVEVQCTPTRSAIMTGRHPVRSGTFKVPFPGEGLSGMAPWEYTLAELLSDAGYATMRANQENIRANSAASYSAFVEALLKWGRCQPGQEREPKFTTLLGSIRTPTLVVTSDNDQLIPKELSDLIAARIAGAKLVVMPGAGHIPFMEQPEEVVRIVLDFLKGVDG